MEMYNSLSRHKLLDAPRLYNIDYKNETYIRIHSLSILTPPVAVQANWLATSRMRAVATVFPNSIYTLHDH